MSLVDEIHACFGRVGVVVHIGFGNQAANILWNFGWDWICPRFLHSSSPACGKAAQPCYRIQSLLTAAEQGSAQGAPSLDVPLCRRRAGEGLFHSAAVRRERAVPCAGGPKRPRGSLFFWGGRSLPPGKPHPPRRRAYRPLRFCRSVAQAAFLLPDCPAAGKRFFFKIIITNPLEFVNRALVVCFFGRVFVHNNEKSGGGSNRLRAGALTAS